MPKHIVEKIGSVTTESVHKCTGKTWDQWIEILTSVGAHSWTHKEIVELLKKKYKLSLWWQQGVTSGYEVHIGRRVVGQNLKGQYSTVATRTFPISQKAAWKYLTSERGLSIWMKPLWNFEFKKGSAFEASGSIFGEIRTLKAPTRARLAWQDTDWSKPTIVQLTVVPRPNGKCIVVFQHEQIAELKTKHHYRDYWKKVLEELLGGLKETK